MLCQLNSYQHEKLVRSWNSAVKIIWNLPYQAHTSFIEQLTNCSHLQAILHSRYVGFASSLSNSKKRHVNVLYSLCRYDISTLTGNNLAFLQRKYNCNSIEELCENRLQISKTSFKKMSPEDQWKIPIIEYLVSYYRLIWYTTKLVLVYN